MNYVAFKIYASDREKPTTMPDAWPRGQVINLGNSQSPPDQSGEWLVMTESEFEGYKAIHRPAYLAYRQTIDANLLLAQNLGLTIKQNKEFADKLLQKLKEKNIAEGLSNINQSAWVHHRLRKIDYVLSDGITVVQLDIMNLVVSGDVETAEQALGQLTPDDMTKSFHWLTQDRVDWIRNEIRAYLGWPLL